MQLKRRQINFGSWFCSIKTLQRLQERDHAAEATHNLAHQGAELRLEVGPDHCPKSPVPLIHLY